MDKDRENLKLPSKHEKRHFFKFYSLIQNFENYSLFHFSQALQKKLIILDLEFSQYDLSFESKDLKNKFNGDRLGWRSDGPSLNPPTLWKSFNELGGLIDELDTATKQLDNRIYQEIFTFRI